MRKAVAGPVLGMMGLGLLGLLVAAGQRVLGGGPRELKRKAGITQLRDILLRYTSPAKVTAILNQVFALPAEQRSPTAVALIAQQTLTAQELQSIEADPELRALIAEHMKK